MKLKSIAALFAASLFLGLSLQSCVVIREGEVGVKRTLGRYKDTPYASGLKVYNPLLSQVIIIPVQTENLEVKLSIPSKEGLNIVSEVSILYHIRAKDSPNILRTIGPAYERNIILPVFRSSVSDVSARFFAKDMHTKERGTIEKAIKEQMMTYLDEKGIEVEAVLLKSIKLPESLANAIEQKLEAEQEAQRMEFVLQQSQKEAERQKIEAAGVRDAQKIIAEGLTKEILQFKSIEAFLELAKSPNTKIILSDGDMPMLMDSEPQ
jgi:prohibitin 1